MYINEDYSKHKESADKRLGDFKLLETSLNIKIVENGYILPHRTDEDNMPYLGIGGVLDSQKQFVKESGFRIPVDKTNSKIGDGEIIWGGAYPFEEINEYLDDKVIWCGVINYNEWGHFIADWCTRLWYPLSVDTQSKIVFCIRENKEIFANSMMLMEMAGIPKERILLIKPDDAVRNVSQIVIPEESMSWKGFHAEHRILFDKIKEYAARNVTNKRKYKKIYFTRRKMKPVREVGEYFFESLFRNNGYAILDPYELTPDEQVYYIMNCNEMASVEGSGAHNIVFSKPGIRQSIIRKGSGENARQDCLTCFMDTDVWITDGFIGTGKRPPKYSQPMLLFRTKKVQNFFAQEFDYRIKTVPLISNFGIMLCYICLYAYRSVVDFYHRCITYMKRRIQI